MLLILYTYIFVLSLLMKPTARACQRPGAARWDRQATSATWTALTEASATTTPASAPASRDTLETIAVPWRISCNLYYILYVNT